MCLGVLLACVCSALGGQKRWPQIPATGAAMTVSHPVSAGSHTHVL